MGAGRTRYYEEARERIDRAVKPYVKIKVWKPKDLSLEELEELSGDEGFLRQASRLVLLYARGKREGGAVVVALSGISRDEIAEDKLEALLDDVEFRSRLTELIREWAGRGR